MRVPVPEEILPAERLGRVHLVGIGGAGLSGIARLLLARGTPVSGSDGVDSPTLDALRALGARVDVGHAATQVRPPDNEVDTVVVSTAVGEDNPEYVEALAQGLRVLPRSAALASLMSGHRVVSVAGTHGKTTTTSLLTVALQAAGADPTYAVGGDLAQTGTNAAAGGGDLFVVEADESDGAFLVYPTFAGVVTNVDADHLDVWGTPAAYAAAFEEFADGLHPDGFLVACADDPGAAAVAGRHRAAGRRVVTVGEHPDADVRLADLRVEGSRSRCDVVRDDRVLGTIELAIPGRHYLLDAGLALATGLELGLAPDELVRGLAGFTGTRRRMEPKGEADGVRVVDSYAHHPTEIAADLAAARSVAGEGRLLVAFQPHLVSRTRTLGAEMGRALGSADQVVVLDVYLAREAADPAVTGALVADAVPLAPDAVAYVPDLEGAAAELVRRARPGDLVLTLGAGSVTEVGPRVLRLLTEREGRKMSVS